MKAIKNLFRLAALNFSAILLTHSISVHAATATILVGSGGLKFVPAVTNISVNDSVVWSWAASGHSSTSGSLSGTTKVPSGLWDSGVLSANQTFTNQFTAAGTFPFYCSVGTHAQNGMTGAVVVAAAEIPTVTVQVGDSSGDLAFFPANASVPVNGRVIWNWAGSFHSTTSGIITNETPVPDGLWDSQVNNAGHSFTNTFTGAGTFPYYCSIHYLDGMTGSITVTNSAPPNDPPTIAITHPANGDTLSAPASLTLAADAGDADGSVTNVEFLQNSVLLGNVATSPFSISVNDLAAADYIFSAIASDNDGATATNSVTIHVINPAPINLSGLTISSPGQFQFSYASDIGLSYVVQTSTNLSSGWISLATNKATANPTIFTDSNATNAGAFYRVGRLPNP